MIVREYKEGDILKENEYLLKLRQDEVYHSDKHAWSLANHKTGFLTKLTKKGELPVAFRNWGGKRYGESGVNHPIYVFEETYTRGWKIMSWRFGQSQNWATVLHPEGFTVEIYLQQLLEVIKENTVDEGVLMGKFKWEDYKLIKQKL
jgi:hypothetical protein